MVQLLCDSVYKMAASEPSILSSQNINSRKGWGAAGGGVPYLFILFLSLFLTLCFYFIKKLFPGMFSSMLSSNFNQPKLHCISMSQLQKEVEKASSTFVARGILCCGERGRKKHGKMVVGWRKHFYQL